MSDLKLDKNEWRLFLKALNKKKDTVRLRAFSLKVIFLKIVIVVKNLMQILIGLPNAKQKVVAFTSLLMMAATPILQSLIAKPFSANGMIVKK